MEKEYRNYSFSEARIAPAEDKDSRAVEGYAAVFDSQSQDLGGFIEIIDRGAFENVIAQSDVFALLNHDNQRGILGRCKYGVGTLSLEVDEKGLKYRFEAPKTALGDEILEYLRRGDISQSSFAFTIEKDTWVKQEDGNYIRTINQFHRLYDISPVYTPAYEATSVKCARFLEIQEEEKRAIEEGKKRADEEAERLKQERIKELHKQLLEEYGQYMKK